MRDASDAFEVESTERPEVGGNPLNFRVLPLNIVSLGPHFVSTFAIELPASLSFF
jgi:hypothetical protein